MVAPRRSRPLDLTPIETLQLPVTPAADRNIPAEAWVEAPAALLALGDEIAEPTVLYLRQLGPFLLWRAGPGRTRSATNWMALDVVDLARTFVFHQAADGTGSGTGPSGAPHERFRSWKEDLRRNGVGGDSASDDA